MAAATGGAEAEAPPPAAGPPADGEPQGTAPADGVPQHLWFLAKRSVRQAVASGLKSVQGLLVLLNKKLQKVKGLLLVSQERPANGLHAAVEDLMTGVMSGMAADLNSTGRWGRVLVIAMFYLWEYIPLKVLALTELGMLTVKSSAPFMQDVWPHERRVLEALRAATAELRLGPRMDIPRRAPHSKCASGYWKSAALADCREYLVASLRDEGHAPAGFGLAPSQCQKVGTGPATAAAFLLRSRCLTDDVQWHMACGFTDLSVRLDSLSAIHHFEVAALALLLCDGCRTDGVGYHAAPLDDMLWAFGTLVAEAAREPPPPPGAGPRPSLYAAVHRAARRPGPPSLWRGRSSDDTLLLRTAGCQAVLGPPVCVDPDGIRGGHAEARRALHTCHYERQRRDQGTVYVGALRPGWTETCEQAPASTVLLILPMYTGLEHHLTSVMIWILGALSWFWGPSGPRLLATLWRHEGLADPPRRLEANSTELLLAPVPDGVVDPGTFLARELFPLLTQRPVRSLLPLRKRVRQGVQQGCRCYSRGAVWGHPEVPFGALGDQGSADVSAVRAAVAASFPRSVRSLPILWRLAPEWRATDGAVKVLLVDRGVVLQTKVNPEKHRRNTTNVAELAAALRAAGRGGGAQVPHLAVARMQLQRLPFVLQLATMLHEVEVLVAAFGATLAWVPFMRAGTYVVQLHPAAAGMPHFGSCFARGGEAGGPWGANQRSEWGAWAQAARVRHACVVRPAMTEERCARQLRPERWEAPEFEADVEATVALVTDAAFRLRAGRGLDEDAAVR